MTLQDEIDSIVYPPSHTYQLEGLVPGEILSGRLKIIEKEFPGFFDSGTLLDVGCNKGFFSLYHKGVVIGIDPEEKCIDLCKKLKPGEEFYKVTFGGYMENEPLPLFNKIFIGNGHHYPFIEAGGWSWVEKLGELCITGGLVLLEGPIDMRGVDAKRCIPDHLASMFNLKSLVEAFSPFFDFKRIAKSSLVKRHFLLFEKRDIS